MKIPKSTVTVLYIKFKIVIFPEIFLDTITDKKEFCHYMFHTEWNWLVPSRVIEVIEMEKADFYRSPRLD